MNLSDQALDVLRLQKAHSFRRGAAAEVFTNPVTRHRWNDTEDQLRHFHAALRALGIRHRDADNTRHTFATRLLMAGVKPAYIARHLGHRNLKMLLEHYARWIEEADMGREAAAANAVLGWRGRAEPAAGG